MEDELETARCVCPVISLTKYMAADLILILRALGRITCDVEEYRRKSMHPLVILDPQFLIRDLREKLDQALAAFQVSILY